MTTWPKILINGLSLLSVCFIAGCAQHNPFEPVSTGSTYFCEQGRQMVLSIGDNAQYAAVGFEGRNLSMRRIEFPNTIGTAYTNSIYTLFIRDNEAALEREGVPVLAGCRRNIHHKQV